MQTSTISHNPYWDSVREHIDPTGSLWRTPEVSLNAPVNRSDYVKRYAWTITDPLTVAFVAEHSRGRLVDVMAGTGYWAWLLTQAGVDVAAYDLNPPAPDSSANPYHRHVEAHLAVSEADATDSAALHPDRTLLLSWPPYGFKASPILDAYTGDRVIYIGEDWGGCCGDDDLFEAFQRDWEKSAEHVPVQWFGMHDLVHVYDRAGGVS